jgi:hypothetical protein
MTVYRMAFRIGSQGYDLWPKCRRHGLAAIGYWPFWDIDLSAIDLSERTRIPGHLLELWDELSSSQKASLRRVVCDFTDGDVIYVKSGKRIVGKGRVVGAYRFDPESPIAAQDSVWPHTVPVEWDPDFQPIEVLLGSEQTTVLQVAGARLRTLEEAVSRRRVASTPPSDDLQTASRPDQEVEQAAVGYVTNWYTQQGWTVRSVENERCGYDLRCAKANIWSAVEVKGTRGTHQLFHITRGEVVQARQNPRFVLCVVTAALSVQRQLFRYSGPDFLQGFELVPEEYMAIPAGEEGETGHSSAPKRPARGRRRSSQQRHYLVTWRPRMPDQAPPDWMGLVQDGRDRRRFRTGDTVWIITDRDRGLFLSQRIHLISVELPSAPGEVAQAIYDPGRAEVLIDELTLHLLPAANHREVRLADADRSWTARRLAQGSAALLARSWSERSTALAEPARDAELSDPSLPRRVERAAIRTATDSLVRNDWAVESVEAERCGYDLHCTKGPHTRCVEVKGVKGAYQRFVVTANELEQARRNRDFALYVVTQALSLDPHLSRYKGVDFLSQFGLLVKSYRAVPIHSMAPSNSPPH